MSDQSEMATSKTYKKAKVFESLRDDPRNDVPAETQTIVFGHGATADYNVITDDGPKRITHDLVQTIEPPEAMTKDEFIDYIQEEVLPLDDD